jgi:hypothetical protein
MMNSSSKSRVISLLTLLAVPLSMRCGGTTERQEVQGQTALINCSEYTVCFLAGCADGRPCVAIDGCSTAICSTLEELCDASCPDRECRLLESNPNQARCEGQPIRGEERPIAPVDAGNEDVISIDAGHEDAQAGPGCEDLDSEFAAVTACESDSDCGQVIEDWPACGCTRQPVARLDADLSDLYLLLSETSELDCAGLGSTCDCPAADGFDCLEGRCTWNYLDLGG